MTSKNIKKNLILMFMRWTNDYLFLYIQYMLYINNEMSSIMCP